MKVQSFQDMLRQATDGNVLHLAAAAGINQAVLSDLRNGRRDPTPKIVNALCDHLGHSEGSPKRRAWNLAAARANGWKV